ncbi:MAG: demethoxyubiquinone hydroxylase family protein, partial [Gammaproteobacteria bacterium]|nr:demethoxyubiquinone hydroxylase family protein [Gammaproteobacteria bacterium]
LAATIAGFRADERAHRDAARAHGAADGPAWAPFGTLIRTGCRAAIWLSERV